ncbi:MAG TPA: polysaccharide deacetylase family protein [Candidatus Methylomirabilis sp.]|nr:polysaccharide deacetylase family protein [Candidatus Methylomirabilis sp.]
MDIGLKIDVCTFDGLRIGVPNVLRLLDRLGVQASFFVALGPDTTGRAILRFLQPGFLAKIRRTRAVRTYGVRTLLSGTLLPPRHAGRRLAPLLRRVIAAGHELAVHGYDHRRWQDGVHRMDEGTVREEIGRAMTVYQEVMGRLPRGFGAPGWQVSVGSLRVLDEMGFAYASDTRGTQPFYPRVAGRALRTLQLPTTCPTLDEALGVDGLDGDGYVAQVCKQLRGKARGILTLHAEMEGIGFQAVADRLIEALHAEGARWLPLEFIAEQVRAEGEQRLPVVEVVSRPICGRAGTVAMPAGLEVPFGPLTTDY